MTARMARWGGWQVELHRQHMAEVPFSQDASQFMIVLTSIFHKREQMFNRKTKKTMNFSRASTTSTIATLCSINLSAAPQKTVKPFIHDSNNTSTAETDDVTLSVHMSYKVHKSSRKIHQSGRGKRLRF